MHTCSTRTLNRPTSFCRSVVSSFSTSKTLIATTRPSRLSNALKTEPYDLNRMDTCADELCDVMWCQGWKFVDERKTGFPLFMGSTRVDAYYANRESHRTLDRATINGSTQVEQYIARNTPRSTNWRDRSADLNVRWRLCYEFNVHRTHLGRRKTLLTQWRNRENGRKAPAIMLLHTFQSAHRGIDEAIDGMWHRGEAVIVKQLRMRTGQIWYGHDLNFGFLVADTYPSPILDRTSNTSVGSWFEICIPPMSVIFGSFICIL